jgi:hypothetical protein
MMTVADKRLWKRAFVIAVPSGLLYTVTGWKIVITLAIVLGGLYVAVRYLMECDD